MIALTMGGQWEEVRSIHWLSMGIGGHVAPLRSDAAFLIAVLCDHWSHVTCSVSLYDFGSRYLVHDRVGLHHVGGGVFAG
jgi:hypothetical protein